MKEAEGQGRALDGEQHPPVEDGPTQKLEDKPVTGALIPGTENTLSEEVKKEISPNTE